MRRAPGSVGRASTAVNQTGPPCVGCVACKAVRNPDGARGGEAGGQGLRASALRKDDRAIVRAVLKDLLATCEGPLPVAARDWALLLAPDKGRRPVSH